MSPPPDAAAAGVFRRALERAFTGLTVRVITVPFDFSAYGAIWSRSKTTCVTGGAALFRPMRTLRTPFELTGMCRCLGPDSVFGNSSTSRSGWLAVTTEALTGALSVTSTRTLLPSRATFTSCTVAGSGAVPCPNATDTSRKRVPNCFCTAVIPRCHSLALRLPPESCVRLSDSARKGPCRRSNRRPGQWDGTGNN